MGMDILKTAELLTYYMQGIGYNRSKELYQDEEKMQTFETSIGVMKSLSQIYKELDSVPLSALQDENDTLAQWSQVKEELLHKYVFMSLAGNQMYFATIDVGRTLTLFCERQGIKCKNLSYELFGRADSFQICLDFDMLLGGSFSDGIKDGVTIALMTDRTLLNAALNSNFDFNESIPGMGDIFSSSDGTNGIRLNIQEPGMIHEANMYGLDIPSGVSAMVGVTARRTRHLRHPYTNCSTTNPETSLLMEAIREKLGNNTPKQGTGIKNSRYSPLVCR